MRTITTEFHFSAAHRLEGHPKCGRLHGHNYKLEVKLTSFKESLFNGMIMDFADVKEIVNPLVDLLDHRYIIGTNNRVHNCPYIRAATGSKGRSDDLVSIAVTCTTAEEMSEWFAEKIAERLPAIIKHLEVTLWETPKSKASYSLKLNTA